MDNLNNYYGRKLKRSEKMMEYSFHFFGLCILVGLLIYLIDFIIGFGILFYVISLLN
jgi:hypothetical protein